MVPCRVETPPRRKEESLKGALFTIEEILEITGARLITEPVPQAWERRIRRLSTDSREIKPGDLFVAFSGDHCDGHEFVEVALRHGAAGAMVREGEGLKSRLRTGRTLRRTSTNRPPVIVEVGDTVKAYQQLAAFHRLRFDIPVVAVSGSNGKTTTKDMVARVLGQRGPLLKTEGNFNNRLGVPRTLLDLTRRHHAAVVEMGVDRQGQTALLSDLVRPNVGVITNIGPDHLELFGSLDGSAQSKAELIDAMPEAGLVVLNADDPYFQEFVSRAVCRVVSFGFSELAQVRATHVTHDRGKGMTFRLVLPDRTRHPLVHVRSFGHHNVSNALAAAAVGWSLGLTGAVIAAGLARFRPAPMRSQVVAHKGVTVLNDCYNANPASMRAAVTLLADIGAGSRTVAVLGDMLELGTQAPEFHRAIGALAADLQVAVLIATGSFGRSMAEGAIQSGMGSGQIHTPADAGTASAIAKNLIRRGDVVLVKGSRGMCMEQVVRTLTKG